MAMRPTPPRYLFFLPAAFLGAAFVRAAPPELLLETGHLLLQGLDPRHRALQLGPRGHVHGLHGLAHRAVELLLAFERALHGLHEVLVLHELVRDLAEDLFPSRLQAVEDTLFTVAHGRSLRKKAPLRSRGTGAASSYQPCPRANQARAWTFALTGSKVRGSISWPRSFRNSRAGIVPTSRPVR